MKPQLGFSNSRSGIWRHLLAGTSLVVLGCVTTGCVTMPSTADIPLGIWKGEGRYVFQRWDNKSDDYAESKAHGKTKVYETSLASERVEIDGVEVTRIEILSMRGPFEDEKEDRTHLIINLAPVQRLSDDASLWRIVNWSASLTEKAPEDSKPPKEPVTATILRHDGATTLQLRYSDGYTDNMVFRGNKLHKYGIYRAEGDSSPALVHWVEELEYKP
ncbi:MAG: hypothetical protein JXO22_13465 [Phycisphaerae bacterium]|nr:hypothetical protein [Phycisphaerae bacterium]